MLDPRRSTRGSPNGWPPARTPPSPRPSAPRHGPERPKPHDIRPSPSAPGCAAPWTSGARCASASTRTRRCWPTGGSDDDVAGWSASPAPWWRRWPTGSRCSSRSPRSSSASARAASPSWRRAVADARRAGALVVMDAKRGDIGSTMAAYAAAYLDTGAPLFSDAAHAQPVPRLRLAAPGPGRWPREPAAGVFVLALTSNPEGAEVQRARRARTAVRSAPDGARPAGRGERGRGAAGLVRRGGRRDAGASAAASTWRSTDRCSPPGIGAQGATAGGSAAGLRRRGAATSCRASAAACCGTARTPAALRDAAARTAAGGGRRGTRGSDADGPSSAMADGVFCP